MDFEEQKLVIIAFNKENDDLIDEIINKKYNQPTSFTLKTKDEYKGFLSNSMKPDVTFDILSILFHLPDINTLRYKVLRYGEKEFIEFPKGDQIKDINTTFKNTYFMVAIDDKNDLFISYHKANNRIIAYNLSDNQSDYLYEEVKKIKSNYIDLESNEKPGKEKNTDIKKTSIDLFNLSPTPTFECNEIYKYIHKKQSIATRKASSSRIGAAASKASNSRISAASRKAASSNKIQYSNKD